MVQNNPFGKAVKEGADFAKAILKDRNAKVDWISVPDFDPQKFEAAMQNVITAQYDAVALFGLSEALQPVVDKAVDDGILVYTFNTEPGMKSKRQAYWGQDGFAGGSKCGQLLADAVGAAAASTPSSPAPSTCWATSSAARAPARSSTSSPASS